METQRIPGIKVIMATILSRPTSASFYAPCCERYCVEHFTYLFYAQFHPHDVPCRSCERQMLQAASFLCWQCRTYFHQYGTTYLQQLVGETPQRHDEINIFYPTGGEDQARLAVEEQAKT